MVSDHHASVLELADVRFGFPTRPEFLGPVSLSVAPGDCWGIVGPNGAGKSTLIRLMAGLLTPSVGTVRLDGRALSRMSARERARRIAYVPQAVTVPDDVDLSVRDVVLLGRFPHRSLGLFESAHDYAVARRAMVTTQTEGFADRRVTTLSGGEAQRVHIAAALAQEPAVLLLDEPTASLDLQHQLGIFRLLQRRAVEGGIGVVVVTHDINLAAQFCAQVLLLDDGRAVAQGPPQDVLMPAVLEPIYGVRLVTVDVEAGRHWIIPVDGPR